MRVLLSLILTGYAVAAFGQKLPEIGMNIRLTEAEKTIVAEIKTTTYSGKADPKHIYYWYSSNHIQQTQGGYSGKLLNGKYQEYYLNKNLKVQGIFKDGLKTDVWKSWTADGKLVEVVSYKKSEKAGPFEYYDENGILNRSGSYKHDQLNGKLTTYRKDSVVTSNYKNGRLIAPKTGPSFLSKLNFFKKKKAAKPKSPK